MIKQYDEQTEERIFLRRQRESKLSQAQEARLTPQGIKGGSVRRHAKHAFLGKVIRRSTKGRSVKSFARGEVGFKSRGAFVADVSPDARRVTVKVRVIQKAAHKSFKPFAGIIQEHIDYLKREGVGKDLAEPQAFNGVNDDVDGEAFAKRLAEDKHHFRLILSPEDGARINLKAYTRDLLQEMALDLNTELEWVAVEHHNTDNPHVHLIIRGKDELGNDLIMRPDYLSNGIRNRARHLATMELGPRKAHEVELSLIRAAEQERVVGIDNKLERFLSNGVFDPAKLNSLDDLESNVLKTRLNKLANLGLAEVVCKERGVYRLQQNFKAVLSELEAQNDVYKRISKYGLAEAKQFGHADNQVIAGKVIGKGMSNELDNKYYVIVDGVDGHQWYVDLSICPPSCDVNLKDWVRFESKGVTEALGPKISDRNILEVANSNNNIYSTGAHCHYMSQPENQMFVKPEVTEDYLEAHRKRLFNLERLKVVEKISDSEYKLVPNFIEEIEKNVQRLAKQPPKISFERLSGKKLTQQVQQLQPTWLDKSIIYPDRLGSLSKIGAGGKLAKLIEQREKVLLGKGLGEMREQKFVPSKGLIEKLSQLEVRQAKQGLIENGYQLSDLKPSFNHPYAGKVVKNIQLSSGEYALLEVERRHVLCRLPAKKNRLIIGERVAFKLGKSAKNLALPMIEPLARNKGLEMSLDM